MKLLLYLWIASSFILLWIKSSQGQCQFGSTDDCIFPCRCASNGCTQDKGTCIGYGGCDEIQYGIGIDSDENGFFTGPTCQIDVLFENDPIYSNTLPVLCGNKPQRGNLPRGIFPCTEKLRYDSHGNVAFQKTAWQTDTWGGLDASRAVDGKGYASNQEFCAHPFPSSPPGYWAVDLGAVHKIVNVTIYNTQNNGWVWLNGITVATSMSNNSDYTGCGSYAGPPNGPSDHKHVITCEVVGRYVRIQRQEDDGYMILCEVMVHGYIYNGAEDCGNNCDNYRCNQWWAPEGKCFRYLRTPGLEDQSNPIVINKTSSIITLCFGHDNAIDTDNKEFYKYYIEQKLASESDDTFEIATQAITHVSNNYLSAVTLIGLRYNTEYEFRTLLRKEQYGNFEVCDYSPRTIRVTTLCENPEPPLLSSSATTNGFRLLWELGNPRCDEYTGEIEIFHSGSDQRDLALHHAVSSVDIVSEPGEYRVYIMVTNNAGLTTQSNVQRVTVIYQITNSNVMTTTTSAYNKDKKDQSEDDSNNSSVGLIIGIVMALLVVVIIAIIIIFVMVRLRNRKQPNKQQGEINTAMHTDDYEQVDFGNSILSSSIPQTTQDQVITDVETNARAQPVAYENINIQSDKRMEKNFGDLVAYIENSLITGDGFRQEFSDIPLIDEEGYSTARSNSENTLTYENSRVLLHDQRDVAAYQHTDDNGTYIDADSKYINTESKANGGRVDAFYLNGYNTPQKYVATQAPANNSIDDMWCLIWQINIHLIIMMTKLKEKGEARCKLYWPDVIGQSKIYGNITVHFSFMEYFADYVIRHFTITKESETRHIKQLQFISWNKDKEPEHAFPILTFRNKVRALDNQRKGPMLVHCSEGMGRSGTFIAIDYLLDQVSTEGVINVFKCVFLMRKKCRHVVQSLEQYQFIYLSILDYLKMGVGTLPVQTFAEQNDDRAKILRQFGLLGLDAKSYIQKSDTDDFSRAPYSSRNRDPTILPLEPYRTHLIGSRSKDGYINAVFVASFHSSSGFIATQMPFHHTKDDFWQMIYDHSSKIIVMLNAIDETDETSKHYWPTHLNVPTLYGMIRVTLNEEEKIATNGLILREFTVSHTRKPNEEDRIIKQFQLTNWEKQAEVPESPESILDVLEAVEKWQEESGPTSVTVHCMNGCDRTGLYCMAAYIIEQMRNSQEVDVFTAVRRVRISRPEFIVSLDQYEFLHKVAQAFLSRNDTYEKLQGSLENRDVPALYEKLM